MEHEDDPDIDEPYVPPAENVLGGKSESKPAPAEPTLADTAEGRSGVVDCFYEETPSIYSSLHEETQMRPQLLCCMCKYCLIWY